MKAFAELLNGLVYMPSRNGKLRLMARYFGSVPDPGRGYALAALAGELDLPTAKPALIRGLVQERVDPVLFGWSYDFVGDLAETTALIWPAEGASEKSPALSDVVHTLQASGRSETPGLIAGWLDAMDADGRYALLKLITGGLRVGISARLAKTALAQLGDKPLAQIEELWHGLEPPYGELFAWLEGRQGPPRIDHRATFRPLMLATPLEEDRLDALDAGEYRAEWKWDGIRIQLVARGGEARIYSRTGDDISRSFPDVVETLGFDAVLDGELLVARDGIVAPFNDLQQRLGRKTVGRKMLDQYPAHVRLYDILYDRDEDLRQLGFDSRRARLETWFEAEKPPRIDVSMQIAFDDWASLSALRADARAAGIEGLMLKHKDSPYQAGRPKGPWFKWKRDALTADCVVMYAQRGHGKRSSFYSDYTFGCWRDNDSGAPELVPVGKAYFGFTDEELREIDRWVRNHTVDRFGPVRAVEPGLVFEVAFDSVHASKRHKSGLAMRFPRVHRIRWDKPPAEADRVDSLLALIE